MASSVRFEFVSTMRKKMFWRDSRGVTYVEAPSVSNSTEEGFYITLEYELDSGADIDLRELLASMDLPDKSPIRKELLSRLNQLSQDQHWQPKRSFRVTMGITAKDLDDAGGVVYLRDFDLILGYDHLRDRAMHPFTKPALIQRMQHQLDVDKMGCALKLVFIDNTRKQPPLWFNHGAGAIEVKPEANPQLEDGIYVFYRRSEGEEYQARFYTLEQANKELGLFVTEVEALNFGNPKAVYDRMIRDQEMELATLKHEGQILTQQHAQWKLEMDREREQLKTEREQQAEDLRRQREREDERRRAADQEWKDEQTRQQRLWEGEQERWRIERQRREQERDDWTRQRDFEYDMRNRDRKDQSEAYKTTMEIVKICLGLIGPGLAAYAIMNKGKDK